MPISIKYKSLFSIDVLHHFFLDKGAHNYESLNSDYKLKQLAFYNVNDFIEITPTPSCAKIIKDYKLIYKQTNQGILIGCKTDETGNKPFVIIPKDLKFTFLLKIKAQSFFNYTALPLKINSDKIFYLNNLDKTNSGLNLSKKPEDFVVGATYEAGGIVQNDEGTEVFIVKNNTEDGQTSDLVKDFPALVYDNDQTYNKGDLVLFNNGEIDQLFESKIDTPEDTPEDVPENEWKKVRDLPLDYINKNDLIKIIKPFYNYTLDNEDIEATAVLSSITGEGLSEIKTEGISETTAFQFDWRRIQSGLYHLLVTDDNLAIDEPNKTISEEIFYLNNGALQNTPFGIIEIFSTQDDLDNFALLNSDGSFKSSNNEYKLRFKNRSTIWRYFFKEGQAVDDDDDVSLEGSDDKILITNEIKPLTKNGFISINKGEEQLPNPNSKNIKPETTNNFSEIYL